MLKPRGHRLDDEHDAIIRKYAKKWKMGDSPALRALLIKFDEYAKKEKDSR